MFEVVVVGSPLMRKLRRACNERQRLGGLMEKLVGLNR